jgi:short subunit dehydrogenase-like uncharacterized protein
MNSAQKWMIYGVTGFTGDLVIQEAIKRGHKPLISGRNAEKLKPIAEKYQLDYVAIDLKDTEKLHRQVAEMDLVFHVAGPYVETAEAMLQACIAGKTHYVDITGEAPVFKRIFELNDKAKAAGICLVSGIGFDVIPTDCLLKHVASKIEKPTHVELAIAPLAKPSAGTAKSALGMIANGKAEIRKDGEIVAVSFGSEVKTINFPSGKKSVSIGPIADIYTAFYSTGARNVKTFMAMPAAAAHMSKFTMPMIAAMLRNGWVKKKLEKLIDEKVKGPELSLRNKGHTEIWARAENAKGDVVEGYLRTGEVYHLTAQVSVRFIEHVLKQNPSGSLAPAQIFPMKELLGIDGVILYDGEHNKVLLV